MQAKRIVAGLLAVNMWFAPVVSAAVGQPNDVPAEKLKQEYLQRLQAIRELANQEMDLKIQLAIMNQQIQEYEQLSKQLQEEIDKEAEIIEALRQDSQTTQDKINSRKQLLQKRIRVIYEQGSISYLEVLMQSANFTDFLDRLGTLALVIKQDKRIIGSMREDHKKLAEIEADLSKKQELRIEQQKTLLTVKAEQEQRVQEQKKLLESIGQELQKEEQEVKAIEEQITPAIAEQLRATEGIEISSAGDWAWPVPGFRYVTSGYGARWGSLHEGIDIGAPKDTPIVSVDNGIVLFAGPAAGFGHWVVIKHNNGLLSVYGHMYGEGIFVTAGQRVERGQKIAIVGNDGQSTGPHLHFAVANGISDNRMNYLDPSPFLKLGVDPERINNKKNH